MRLKLTGSHSGPLNMRVAFTLNGVHRGDGAAELIELMRSSETIDRQTREAIANALERRSGVRLEFHKSNEAPFLEDLETELKYQEIADSVAALLKAGAVPKNAKRDVAEKFGVSLRTVSTALRRRRGSIFRVEKVERG